MGEESHLDEMRSAIRGDFERLAERRGEQQLLRVQGDGEELEAEPEVALESPHEPERDGELESEPPRRSWLSRLLNP